MAGHNRISMTGTSAFPIGAGSDEIIGSIVFEVSASTAAFSVLPKAALGGSGTTAANIAYKNLLTGASVAAGTAITADGVYGVFCPAMVVGLTASSGTATVDWAVVAGKV